MSGRLILVVDDDKPDRWYARHLLAEAGYAVTTADSAAAALRIVDGEPIDAMVIDLRMPRTGGLDLLRTLRRREHQMPAVVVSWAAHLPMGDREEIGALGAIFVAKGEDFRTRLTDALWRVMQ